MNLKSKKIAAAVSVAPAENFFVVCQNIRSLFNVGAIFRTADAFAVNKIFLTGITGRPPRREISKVALGAENWIESEYHKQPVRLVRKLKKSGLRIVALEKIRASSSAELRAKVCTLPGWHPQFPLALMLGYETRGLPKSLLQLADDIIEIPMYGKKESLNVGIAFGIAASYIANFLHFRKNIV